MDTGGNYILGVYLRAVIVCTVGTVLSCFIINPVWGFYDSYAASLFSGSVTGVPITETFHLGIYPLAKLLGMLHKVFPNLPWAAITLMICWVYVQSLFVTLSVLLQGKTTFKLSHILLYWLATMAVVFGVSFIEMSFTGIGILISGISIAALWYLVVNNPFRGITKVLSISFLLLGYYAGFTFRVESGLGGTLMGFFFIVFMEVNIVNLIKVLALPLAITGVFLFQLSKKVDNHVFFRDVEPLVFYVTDSKNTPQYIPLDSVDALKIEMVKASMLIDTTYLNYELYSRLATQKWEYEKTLTHKPAEVWSKIKTVVGLTIADNKVVTIVYLLLLFGAIVFLYQSDLRKHAWKLFGVNASIWIVIAVLGYTMKMEKWHYIPILQSAGYITVLYFVAACRGLKMESITKYWQWYVVTLFVTALSFLSTELISLHRITAEKRAIVSSIFNGNDDKLIFMDVATREVLDEVLLHQFSPHPNLYLYDMAQLPFLPEYEKYLNNFCGCNSHKADQFFSFLKTKSEDIHYYSSPHRVGLISKFLRYFYNIDVTFEPTATIELKEKNYGCTSLTRYRLIFK